MKVIAFNRKAEDSQANDAVIDLCGISKIARVAEALYPYGQHLSTVSLQLE